MKSNLKNIITHSHVSRSVIVMMGIAGFLLGLMPFNASADTYYFTVNSVPAVTTNPGNGFTTTAPSSSAYGVSQITSTPQYWYTDPTQNCNYNAGAYNIALITHQLNGQTSNVNVELDIVDPSGNLISP